jgi:hypothetical protein
MITYLIEKDLYRFDMLQEYYLTIMNYMTKRDFLKTLYIEYKKIKKKERQDFYPYKTFENYFYMDKTMTLGRIIEREPLKSYKYYCGMAVEL